MTQPHNTRRRFLQASAALAVAPLFATAKESVKLATPSEFSPAFRWAYRQLPPQWRREHESS